MPPRAREEDSITDPSCPGSSSPRAAAGEVKGGRKVDFQNKAVREFVEELAENELADVRFYRKTLGSAAVGRLEIDFEAVRGDVQRA